MFRLVFALTVIVAIANGLNLSAVQLLDGRIVGGEDADIQNYPYQVSLRYGVNKQLLCGGSIHNEWVIVTAAHCLQGFSAKDLSVVAGQTNINQNSKAIAARKTLTNSKYNPSTIDNDVGLVFLSEPLTFGPGVQPIALAKENPAPGTQAVVTGWGTTREGGSLSNTLQVVDVNIEDQKLCSQKYGSNSITDNMLCAGVENGGKDACQGDSGGPLVTNGVLSGIVSWGYGCARPNYPGVYTAVAAFADWIEQNAKQ